MSGEADIHGPMKTAIIYTRTCNVVISSNIRYYGQDCLQLASFIRQIRSRENCKAKGIRLRDGIIFWKGFCKDLGGSHKG